MHIVANSRHTEQGLMNSIEQYWPAGKYAHRYNYNQYSLIALIE